MNSVENLEMAEESVSFSTGQQNTVREQKKDGRKVRKSLKGLWGNIKFICIHKVETEGEEEEEMERFEEIMAKKGFPDLMKNNL